jgi:hypothetical protein
MLENLLFGLLNGVTAWPLLILHVFSVLMQYPVYDVTRDTDWRRLTHFGFYRKTQTVK